MLKLFIFYVIYIYLIYQIYNKAKNSKLELVRFKENVGRTIFIQLSFATLDALQNRFEIVGFLYRFLFSMIAFTLYPIVKDILDQIKFL
jgi:hypothetical protein